MTTADILRARRDRIIQLAAHHGARNVRVLVQQVILMCWWRWTKDAAQLDLIELSQELEAFRDRKVDIHTDEGLSPYLEQRIHAEAVLL